MRCGLRCAESPDHHLTLMFSFGYPRAIRCTDSSHQRCALGSSSDPGSEQSSVRRSATNQGSSRRAATVRGVALTERFRREMRVVLSG